MDYHREVMKNLEIQFNQQHERRLIPNHCVINARVVTKSTQKEIRCYIRKDVVCLGRVRVNHFWKRQPLQKKSHLLPISSIVQERRIQFAKQPWWRRNRLDSEVSLWTTKHGHIYVGCPFKRYIQRLCVIRWNKMQTERQARRKECWWRRKRKC